MTAASNTRPYFQNLDGLRFFAFLFVFISHATLFIWQGPSFLAQGGLGVSFFFVLSGFLITYLLFFEKEITGNPIKLSNFYARRILRIWPVYFITLCAGIVIAHFHIAHLPLSTTFKTDSIFWYTVFIANFYLIANPTTSVILAVLWSISVEEQFYFIWPLLLTIIKRRFIPLFLCSLIVIATVFRFLYADQYNTVAYSTFSAMSDLAIGALLGYSAFNMPSLCDKTAIFFTKSKTLLLYGLFIIFLGIKMFSGNIIPYSLNSLYVAVMPVIFSIIFALIIFEQNYSSQSLFKVGKSKTATYLGKISYGLYTYHIIAITAVFYLFSLWGGTSKITITILSFIIAIVLAFLSYTYIEQKILKLKSRLH